MALVITDSNFKEYLEGGKPFVLDFWAPWCGPCRMVSPIIEELAEVYGDRVNIGKMDCDENNDVCVDYGIRNIPTILFFKDGKPEPVDKHIGAATRELLVQKIEALL